MKTRSQEFAETVYHKVKTIKDRKDNKGKEDKAFRLKYGSMSHKLPILIRSAGLVQALEFVASRKEEALDALLDHLAQIVGSPSGSLLRDEARKADLLGYMRLTNRSLDALTWFKRFAESVLEIRLSDVADAAADDSIQISDFHRVQP
jgi:CRISPR-associated protein Cmr5